MRRVFPSMATVLLAVAAATQDAPRTVLESRPAPDAGKLRFLERFTPDHRTVFVLDDPLPHVDRLLKSEPLRRIVFQAHRDDAGHGPDAAVVRLAKLGSWWMALADQWWVPRQAVVAVPESAWESVSHLIGVAMWTGLSRASLELGELAKKEREECRTQLLAELGALRFQGLTVYVDSRKRRDAAELMEGFRGLWFLSRWVIPIEFQLRSSCPRTPRPSPWTAGRT
jgi:hypothetical protein